MVCEYWTASPSICIGIIWATIYTKTLYIDQITKGQEGAVVVLKCKMSKPSQVFDICGIFKPKWYVNGNLINATSDDQSDEIQRLRKKYGIFKDGCQLVISDATTEDCGNYMVVFAGRGSQIMLSCEDIIIRCAWELKGNTYQTGKDISLVVGMNSPEVAIDWFKDGQILTSSSRITIETQRKFHYLVIKSAILNDAGNYEVRLKDTGTSISSAKIEVQTEEMERRRNQSDGYIQQMPHIYRPRRT